MHCPTCRIPLSSQDYWCSQCGQYFNPQNQPAPQKPPYSNPQPGGYQQPAAPQQLQQPYYGQQAYGQPPYGQPPNPYVANSYQQPAPPPPGPRKKDRSSSFGGGGRGWLGGTSGLAITVAILRFFSTAGRIERTLERTRDKQQQAAVAHAQQRRALEPPKVEFIRPPEVNLPRPQMPEPPRLERPPFHRPASAEMNPPAGMNGPSGMGAGSHFAPAGPYGASMHPEVPSPGMGPGGMPGAPSSGMPRF